jgi:hypothetical protein
MFIGGAQAAQTRRRSRKKVDGRAQSGSLMRDSLPDARGGSNDDK